MRRELADVAGHRSFEPGGRNRAADGAIREVEAADELETFARPRLRRARCSEIPGCTVTESRSIFSTRFILDKSSCVPPLAVTQRVVELPEPIGRTGLG